MPNKKRSLARALALAIPLVLAGPAVVQAAGHVSAKASHAHSAPPAAPTDAPQQAQSAPRDAQQQGQQQAEQQAQALDAQQDQPVLKPGDKGEAVTRAQILLDRDWFAPGEIDGIFGDNMREAVLAFQRSHGLAANGQVDAGTWQALAQGQQAPFTTYALQQEDVGPFQQIPEQPQQQAQLKRLGYQSTLEELGEKFHSAPHLLVALNKGRPARVGEVIVVPAVGNSGPPQGVTSLHIDKKERMMYLVGKDGGILGAFPVSIGDSQDPLPDTTLKITSHVRNPDFRYDASLLRDYSGPDVRVPPGPNNPVGVMWMELSKPHWGIHGNPEPSQMRRVSSNGCVRLTNWDALRVASVVKIGTPVEVSS